VLFYLTKNINSYPELVEGQALRNPATCDVRGKHYAGANSRGRKIPRDKI